MTITIEGDAKIFADGKDITQQIKELFGAKDCAHEYQNDFGKDSRPRFEKVTNPKCKHCGEFYK